MGGSRLSIARFFTRSRDGGSSPTRIKPFKGKTPSINRPRKAWETRARVEPSLLVDGLARFFNESGPLYEWENPNKSRFWLHELHSFDDLRAENAPQRDSVQRELIERWIKDNPPAAGTGWEPDPTARRIANWLQWLLAGNPPVEGMVASLAQQAHALGKLAEDAPGGHHLITRARALIFAGTVFDGKAAAGWLRQGMALLDVQLGEQILPDGGHIERSPMLHCIVLMELLDLIQLGQLYRTAEVARWLTRLRDTATALVAWLDGMLHPDAQIPFFNDAAFGVTPTPRSILDYARHLGAARRFVDSTIQHFDMSGYVSVHTRDQTALIDTAPLAPDHLSDHAHADTLSFEWSLFGQRVLVNSGTSEYGDSPERARQRGTAAHNTVVVNGEDSSELASESRGARRARPFEIELGRAGECAVVRASHDGYNRPLRKLVHTREWRVLPGELQVKDRLSGRYREAVARFHLHPEVEVRTDEHGLLLVLPKGEACRVDFSGGSVEVQPGTWHPELGLSVPSRCIAVTFNGPAVETVFRY